MAIKDLDFSQAVKYHYGKFPPHNLDYEQILPALNDAAVSLGRFDAKMSGMVNSALLLAPLRRQDAVSSSRMEGTISTIEELYRVEAEADSIDPYGQARDDDIETYLYSRALRHAEQSLQENPTITEHLIRSAHQTLLSFGRGANKNPGSYKTEQNFIGNDRTGVIYYIPISPEQINVSMRSLVEYVGKNNLVPLLRTAIAHVEFEALHPFEDGNGRIGRMLITLMLWQLRVLDKPYFFVSGHFEKHKDEYVERMRAVSEHDDWTGWIVFFLNALSEQAKVNSQTADQIFGLYSNMREKFRKELHSQYHDRALDYVFGNPVFRNDSFVDRANIPASSARALIRKLVDVGLLRTLQPPSGRRAALYAFDPLLNVLKV
jgi:Fic family protein